MTQKPNLYQKFLEIKVNNMASKVSYYLNRIICVYTMLNDMIDVRRAVPKEKALCSVPGSPT